MVRVFHVSYSEVTVLALTLCSANAFVMKGNLYDYIKNINTKNVKFKNTTTKTFALLFIFITLLDEQLRGRSSIT